MGETLTGPGHKRIDMSQEDPAGLSSFSPTTPGGCAQDKLELILLAHTRSFPKTDLSFNTELLSFQEVSSGTRPNYMTA